MEEIKKEEIRKCPKCGNAFKLVHPEEVVRCQTCGYLLSKEEKNEKN